MKQLLDSRFLIEYYYSQNKKTQQKINQKIKDLIRTQTGIIPTIVLCEITQVICTKQGKQNAELIYLSLTNSGLKIENLTPIIAKEAGIFKSKHKDVPMGDCIIAATANTHKAQIISDDPHFDSIKTIKRIWI